MFKMDGKDMYLNRGDNIIIKLTNKKSNFKVGDYITFSIVKENDYTTLYFQKRYDITEESETFSIVLEPDDTRFIDLFKTGSKTFWYEIELNGAETLIGYDTDGGKKFVLYPEAPKKEINIEPEPMESI